MNRRGFTSGALAVLLAWGLGDLPAQSASSPSPRASATLSRTAVETVLADLDAAFSGGRTGDLLELFAPENPELMGRLECRLDYLFAMPARLQRTSRLVGDLRVVGPRTVALVRSEITIGPQGSAPAASDETAVEYHYLVFKDTDGRAVPVFIVEVFDEMRGQAPSERFTCQACNYGIGGVDGWLAVPLPPNRTDAMEAVSFYLLGTDLALDVSVHVDGRAGTAADRMDQLVAEWGRLADVRARAVTDWLPPGFDKASLPRLTGRRAFLDEPGGTTQVLHLLALGKLRYLLVLKGRGDQRLARETDIDALLRSFSIHEPKRPLPELAEMPLRAHHGGRIEGCTFHHEKRNLLFRAPDGWRGALHGGGHLFKVSFSCERGTGKLWLTGYAPPARTPRWTQALADMFLADYFARRKFEDIENSGWTAAVSPDGFALRTVHGKQPSAAEGGRAIQRVFRLAMADDLLIVLSGVTRDPGDERQLITAFDSLTRPD